MTQTPLWSKQQILRKQPKKRSWSKSNKTGETNLCMESTLCKSWCNQGNTHQWLYSASLKAETEGFIMGAQDQSLFARNYHAKIINNGTDPKCWFYEKFEETLGHLVFGCPIMTANEYLQIHDRVGWYICWKMHHMLRTSTSISHRKLYKQKVQQFYGISLFIQTEQYKLRNQT